MHLPTLLKVDYVSHVQGARKAWNVGRVARIRNSKALIATSNIQMCGVKYTNPRRNQLKRRKLE